MLSRDAWELRKAEDDLDSRLHGVGRLVDMGVLLRVVVQDPTGEELVPGKPRLRVVREHSFGGVVDTRARPPKFVGPSLRPQVWHCGEAQERVLLDDRPKPSRHLVYGAMGGGKTELLAMWAWLQIIALTGTALNVGLTAPTEKRATILRDAMIRRAPASWFRGGSVAKGWSERRGQFRFANGIRADVLSTHVSSEAEGSRLQGRSWGGGVGSDEIQDGLDADAEIESRGRDASRGVFRRLATCTPKMAPEWREFSDARKATPDVWALHHLTGFENPFTWPEYLEEQRRTLSQREYERRVLGRDLPPERAVYPTWSRDASVQPVPQIGAVDVTAQVLARWCPNATVLVGHDPGQICNASVFLKAYRLPNEDLHSWWVVDELTTEATTTEQHAVALLERLRTRWRCNELDRRGRPVDGGPVALVRVDPHSKTHVQSDARPDETVIKVLRNHGLRALPAAYSQVNPSEPGVLPKEAGIEMVVGLICAASGKRRLFVNCDDRRQPVAPRLVEALESMERDEGGRAERERKRKGEDRSHWPAALRYALWILEQPRYGGGSSAVRG